MKKFSKLFSLAALILSVVLSLCSCGSIGESLKLNAAEDKTIAVNANQKQVSVKPSQEGITEDTKDYKILEFEEIARNSNSILYADLRSGHFALQDIETEAIWYDTPNNAELDEITSGTESMEIESQLLLRYILKEDESKDSSYKVETSQSVVKDGNVTCEKIENGFKVIYEFSKSGITLPVKFYLTDTAFRAEIIAKDISEGKTAYLIGVNLLPSFGAGDWDDEGYAFVPDGSGALMDFSYKRYARDRYERQIYGEERAVNQENVIYNSEPMLLPVFGIAKGNSSIMGIITEGDADASITVYYHSDTYGYTAPSSVFNYRITDSKTMFAGQGGISNTINRVSKIKASTDKYQVEYSVLNGENSGYVGMAKHYRDYLKANNALKGNKSAPKFNLEIYGAADLTTSFLGFDYSTTEILTTASQAEEIIKELKDNNISDIAVRYRGFSGDGILNKKLNTSASPISKLGGKKEFAALAEIAELYPDYDFMQVRKSGKGISFSKDVVHTLFDYTAPQYTYSRSTYSKQGFDDVYLLNPPAILGAVNKLIKNYSKAGYKNISLSALGNTLYSDFHTKQGMYRDEAVKYIEAALENISKSCEGIAVEGGNAYTLKYADRVFSAPTFSSGYDIFYADVPFYQIALRGSVALTSPTIIQSQEPSLAILKAAETGSELLFGCTYEESTVLIGSRYENLYSTAYKNWIGFAAETYADYSKLLDAVDNKAIVNHTEAQSGVFVTEYEGGISVAVNYNDEAVTLASGAALEAMSYKIIDGGAK